VGDLTEEFFHFGSLSSLEAFLLLRVDDLFLLVESISGDLVAMLPLLRYDGGDWNSPSMTLLERGPRDLEVTLLSLIPAGKNWDPASVAFIFEGERQTSATSLAPNATDVVSSEGVDFATLLESLLCQGNRECLTMGILSMGILS
jgi:hypothetical protein